MPRARPPHLRQPVAPATLDERQCADYLGLSARTLQNGRQAGHMGNHTPAPPYLKLGGSVRYLRADLDKWLGKRRVLPAGKDKV